MTISTFALATALAAAFGAQAGTPEPRKIPKDSIQLVVAGCLKDRMLRASDVKVPDDPGTPTIDRETFRLSGPRDLMKGIKDQNGRRVSVTGLVRKIDLQEPGLKLKGGRIVIGGPSSAGSGRAPLPDTTDHPVVLEVVSFEPLPEPCTKP